MSKKVAVITGSADGLGKGIAERLAADGFRIVLSDINAGQLAATEQEFKRNGHEVTSFVGNVARRDDQFALVAHAVATFGQVDVFINNAGIEDVMPLDAVREPDLEKVFSVNVLQRGLWHAGRGRTDEEAGHGRQDHQCLQHCRA
ncbi:SDR family NAD(P)-dependent oxidoreductase [Thauera humireducens]|uniref:SDR family NAD(P)-dependent oxidoreductase n=1 Tax=Thauera humireducens TaxID=1134435 RepID=UPI00311EF119